MTLIVTPEAQTVKDTPSDVRWQAVMGQLAACLKQNGAHASRTVVLVPYAQLMQQARTAWAAHAQSLGLAAAFVPRFETTMNWASATPGFALSPEDIRMDAAIDALTAASLLNRAGLGAQQHLLGARLVEAAWGIARLAAAQPPGQRLAWGAAKGQELGVGMDSPALAFELAVARIALVWAAASSYATDVLFDRQLVASLDFLVVLEGFQVEPLTEALKRHHGDRAASIKLETPTGQGALALHTARDLEDEAHLAAACVLSHLASGRSPVALIAQDRLLTRRVSAMLANKGVALRDETGWKLSTTRAAATLMGLLRAMHWDASTDTVLDWLKNAPAFDASAVTLAETALRKLGVRDWRVAPAAQPELAEVLDQAASYREAMVRSRSLTDWLQDLRSALQTSGQWMPLAGDAAGMAVLAALHMSDDVALPINPRMSLQDFSQWVNQTLEAASFAPPHPAQAQVVLLPLSQLLGRPVQAVVLPGCDDMRLAVCPEPAGPWTPTQRALLGLPSRAELAQAQRAAWQHALTAPHLDVLWRLSEGGESLMPSGFVQELLLAKGRAQKSGLSPDPRPQRMLTAQPTPQPAPTGQALAISTLSASAYEDLRRCPYRFFALRQLKLQEADELDNELGKRDFGNWLHLLLNIFQNALKKASLETSNTVVDQHIKGRKAMINIAADEATKTLGLSAEEFLPFAAIWPRVRDGYLDWLATHEASGASYAEGEVWKRMPLGHIELVGKIDRIDRLPDGSRLVMDYKTESASTTKARINDAGEDTQLAFYAALLEDDTLAAAYVNLGEKEVTKTYPQPELVDLRDELIGGILSDMQRIAEGAALPALGEGKACEFCAARGLCRKDFWS
ncbi:MAG: PD-(D/E)XK nuclease family protein [Polaromonas sp.]|jgi:ATP-dependent helicase/nuclease subunit B